MTSKINISQFYDDLQDRLSAGIRQIFLDERFTLFINTSEKIIDRTFAEIKDHKIEEFIYVGVKKQRERLEITPHKKNKELDKAWKFIEATNLKDSAQIDIISKVIYGESVDDKLALNGIKNGTLKNYFRRINTKNQKHERIILDTFFDIKSNKSDYYLSIPLIQFGKIDGVVHLVYESNEHHKFFDSEEKINQTSIKYLINSISSEYEKLILFWSSFSEQLKKDSLLDNIFDRSTFNKVSKNKIFQELGLISYYGKEETYIKHRLERPAYPVLYKAYLKLAIISILVDSYAHNVSAHSMTSLAWLFKQKEVLNRKLKEAIKEGEIETIRAIHSLKQEFDYVDEYREEILKLTSPWIEKDYSNEKDTFISYKKPINKELSHLCKYLTEKGAFWSGITRDFNFGGKSVSFFDTLWTDFICNPLYLGTIASTEKIQRINFKVVIYEDQKVNDSSNELWIEKKTAKDCADMLAHIDINHPRENDPLDEDRKDYYVDVGNDKLYYSEFKELNNRSVFVQPGAGYRATSSFLKRYKIFFPGGIVGQHAFYTILENEIRNVKHYHGEALSLMRKKGLTIAISIQKSHLKSKEKEKKLFKIGVWLDHPARTRVSNLGESDNLVYDRYEKLHESIMKGGYYTPKLGGTYQDKICAAMLFNNSFTSVQKGSKDESNIIGDTASERDKSFYPWIISGASRVDQPNIDLELKSNKNPNVSELLQKACSNLGKESLFKKFLYLWKGEDIYELSKDFSLKDSNLNWENVSRFRFVRITNKKSLSNSKKFLRKKKIFRIISKRESSSGNDLLASYEDWLHKWLIPGSISLEISEKNAGIKLNSLISYVEYDAKAKKIYYDRDRHVNKNLKSILISHQPNPKDKEIIHYRNHGIFKQYFADELIKDPIEKKIRMAELLEALETKICIFDNRAKARMEEGREDFYRKKLNLVINEEEKPERKKGNWVGKWEEEMDEFIPGCNILVIHLSFIDSILDAKSEFYNDIDHAKMKQSKIGIFIEKEVLSRIKKKNGPLRENFLLFITTGRGRIEWWEDLINSKTYRDFEEFTSFKPIESIIGVIENAVSKRDEFELKYNLVKILLGS